MTKIQETFSISILSTIKKEIEEFKEVFAGEHGDSCEFAQKKLKK